jgi:hypothetical protein
MCKHLDIQFECTEETTKSSLKDAPKDTTDTTSTKGTASSDGTIHTGSGQQQQRMHGPNSILETFEPTSNPPTLEQRSYAFNDFRKKV